MTGVQTCALPISTVVDRVVVVEAMVVAGCIVVKPISADDDISTVGSTVVVV